MHRNSLLVAVFLYVPLSASADPFADTTKDIIGSMECSVTSQVIIGSNEGKPEEFSGVEGQYDVGDKLTLSYGYNKAVFGSSIYARIEDRQRENELLSQTISLSDASIYSGADEITLSFVPDEKLLEIFSINPDLLYVNVSGWHLYLERYYKSDWHGVLVLSSLNSPLVHTTTLDCRQEVDAVDEFVDALRTVAAN